jgi:hypothetical protein
LLVGPVSPVGGISPKKSRGHWFWRPSRSSGAAVLVGVAVPRPWKGDAVVVHRLRSRSVDVVLAIPGRRLARWASRERQSPSSAGLGSRFQRLGGVSARAPRRGPRPPGPPPRTRSRQRLRVRGEGARPPA